MFATNQREDRSRHLYPLQTHLGVGSLALTVFVFSYRRPSLTWVTIRIDYKLASQTAALLRVLFLFLGVEASK